MITVKIRVWISTRMVGSTCYDEVEIDREDWEAMTDDEKEDSMRAAALENTDWGWEEIA